MHSRDIIHCDIKPNNLLIKYASIENQKVILDVKVADFDISKIFEEPETFACTIAGNYYFIAPELRNRDGSLLIYGALDVFSFGATMHVLLSGFRPRMNDRFETFISAEDLFQRFNTCLSKEQAERIHVLGSRCVDDNSNERPTFVEILDELVEITTDIYCTYLGNFGNNQN